MYSISPVSRLPLLLSEVGVSCLRHTREFSVNQVCEFKEMGTVSPWRSRTSTLTSLRLSYFYQKSAREWIRSFVWRWARKKQSCPTSSEYLNVWWTLWGSVCDSCVEDRFAGRWMHYRKAFRWVHWPYVLSLVSRTFGRGPNENWTLLGGQMNPNSKIVLFHCHGAFSVPFTSGILQRCFVRPGWCQWGFRSLSLATVVSRAWNPSMLHSWAPE